GCSDAAPSPSPAAGAPWESLRGGGLVSLGVASVPSMGTSGAVGGGGLAGDGEPSSRSSRLRSKLSSITRSSVYAGAAGTIAGAAEGGAGGRLCSWALNTLRQAPQRTRPLAAASWESLTRKASRHAGQVVTMTSAIRASVAGDQLPLPPASLRAPSRTQSSRRAMGSKRNPV